MAQLKSIAPYRDILGVLQTAIEHDSFPVEVKLHDGKAAITWRARAYKAIALCRRHDEAHHGLLEGTGASQFDMLKLLVEDNKVLIVERTSQEVVIINGEVVETAPYNPNERKDDDGLVLDIFGADE